MSAVLENTKACEERGSTDLITDNETGELVCTECGAFLLDTMIDTGSEWRVLNPVRYIM